MPIKKICKAFKTTFQGLWVRSMNVVMELILFHLKNVIAGKELK